MKFDEKELENFQDLMFHASRGANQQLFGGLLPYLLELADNQKLILEELDYIKSCIRLSSDNKK